MTAVYGGLAETVYEYQPGDDRFPARLGELSAPNIVGGLWIVGNVDLLSRPAVSIVGSRAATPYGLHVAYDIAQGVANAGYTVVSGGAFGIDAAAHRGAMGEQGHTIVVLPCGIERPYPSAHVSLYRNILSAGGAIISQFPPEMLPTRWSFLDRNGVIAALGQAVVVVEASERSGSMNTVVHALEMGRPIMAVPGPVTSAVSTGCHRLIQDRTAELVTGADQVLMVVERPVSSGVSS